MKVFTTLISLAVVNFVYSDIVIDQAQKDAFAKIMQACAAEAGASDCGFLMIFVLADSLCFVYYS